MSKSNLLPRSRLALGLAIALAAAPAFAQQTSSALGGVVVGNDGAPLPNAEVIITHTQSGTITRATTDENGRYSARGLRVGGPYSVLVIKDGFQSKSSENVFLQLAQTGNVSVFLEPATQSLDVVEVVATASALFTPAKMGSGTSVDQQTINSLPSIGGNIQDYMRLDPRVAFTDRASGSISAGGQNPRFNKITIDGVSASDTFGLEGNNMPTQRQPVSMEAIEAIDINLSSYDVSISGASGANVNAVTKSGTNEFHGSVYDYYRDGDWFGDNPINGQPFSEFSEENTYGATFGGPLIQDRLFFFLNYEKFKRGKPSPDLSTTPLLRADGDFDADDLAEVQRIARDVYGFDPGGTSGDGDTELEEKAVKIDWNINDYHRASLRYSQLDQTRVRPEGSGASILALSSNWYDHQKSVESYVGQVFSDWTDTFSTEFKASYRDYSAVRVNPTTAPAIQIYFDDGNPNNQPTASDFIRLGTERSSMGNTLLTETYDYFGSATWIVGDHDIKFGAEYQDNEIFNFFLQDFYGNYSFEGIDNFLAGNYFDYDIQVEAAPGSIPAVYDSTNLGLFIQDTWYVSPNLSLTLGLRADRPDTSPDPRFNPCFASPRVPNGTGPADCPNGGFGLNNTNTFPGDFIVQPRFGFNYTFDWERPTQLRGGVGLFQGGAPSVWVGNAYNSTGFNSVSYTNLRFDTSGIPFSPDGLNQPVDLLGQLTGSATRNVNLISDDFELPSVWKANLAFDHELPWYGIVASAEVLLTSVENGLFYRTLNTGAGFAGPDGRTLYWNPSAANFLSSSNNRFGRNSFFGDVYLLENTNKGEGQQMTLSMSKPFSADSDWAWSLGYTYTDANEVGALTSSTAGSGYGSQYGFNVNEEVTSTARYEIKHRFSGAVNWKHAFFGDYQTRVGLFYEGRSGRPFSYIFTGDANGDGRTFNDLFYVPAGPGDVLFGSINSSGVFTPNPQAEQDFFNWLATQEHLSQYAGTYAPENGFRAGWVNTFDLRFSQELPGFMEGHKSEIWLDIQNVGNLINEDWGHVLDYGFFGSQSVASLVGIDRTSGRYVYNYRSGTEFGQRSALGIPTDSDGQTNGISQWSLQIGFRYRF
ncbi:TonB-dependent receptor [Pseudomarimonas arenosa]|uniref:TonB-dependent receptor n=1 Tax=Pseudomarimonas arenosa TaxID=2774145 RepID=A0AAW3ZP51_9GAMM|nr:carboxypeptidase regulatory-like domain-containing protein [Pseudomarimonas arenosa]MBD8527299.1 TonB-dependent receptor [Pseudomarimonas arenosa]